MPWAFDKSSCQAACDAMRLRHSLIPYIYSATRVTYTSAVPLVKPMYYANPTEEAAFCAPAQYWFGSEFVAAPITSPPHPDTGLSRQIVWLPHQPLAAPWRHLFTGEAYAGDQWHVVYGNLDYVPMFGKPGGIIPMAKAPEASARGAEFNSIDNPTGIDLTVIAGGSGSFNLFEDEECDEQRSFVTRITTKWCEDGRSMQVLISPPIRVAAASSLPVARSDDNGDASCASIAELTGVIPTTRNWTIRMVGVCATTDVSVKIGDSTAARPPLTHARYCNLTESLTFGIHDVCATDAIAVETSLSSAAASDANASLLSVRDRTEDTCKHLISSFNLGIEKKWNVLNLLPSLMSDVSGLSRIVSTETVRDPTGTTFTLTPAMKQALVETIDGSGCGRSFLSCPSAPAIIWAGPHHPLPVKLTVNDGTESTSLSKGETRIVHVRPGCHGDTVSVGMADVVRIDIPLRDPDDVNGWPSPVVTAVSTAQE
jgi:Glycosyl hydrolases family 31